MLFFTETVNLCNVRFAIKECLLDLFGRTYIIILPIITEDLMCPLTIAQPRGDNFTCPVSLQGIHLTE